jgi:hypothetical protein
LCQERHHLLVSPGGDLPSHGYLSSKSQQEQAFLARILLLLPLHLRKLRRCSHFFASTITIARAANGHEVIMTFTVICKMPILAVLAMVKWWDPYFLCFFRYITVSFFHFLKWDMRSKQRVMNPKISI